MQADTSVLTKSVGRGLRTHSDYKTAKEKIHDGNTAEKSTL